MLVTSIIFPFPTMFPTLSKPNITFSFTFTLSSANAFILDRSKILSLVKRTISQTNLCFYMCLQYKSFENSVRKEEIAHNEHFFLFPATFSTLSINFHPFQFKTVISRPFQFRRVQDLVFEKALQPTEKA